MKTIRIISLILLFNSCAKKQMPYFQNNTQPNYSTKNKIADNIENIFTQNVPQNQNLATISPNPTFLKDDLPNENHSIAVEEKTILKSKIQKKERVKLKQIVKIKQSNFQDNPKFEKLSNAAGTFGAIALGLILITIVLAFTSEYVLFFILPTLIFANIALILGSISVKKVEKKGKAKFAIAVGLIWDIILIAFIIWLGSR